MTPKNHAATSLLLQQAGVMSPVSRCASNGAMGALNGAMHPAPESCHLNCHCQCRTGSSIAAVMKDGLPLSTSGGVLPPYLQQDKQAHHMLSFPAEVCYHGVQGHAVGSLAMHLLPGSLILSYIPRTNHASALHHLQSSMSSFWADCARTIVLKAAARFGFLKP